MAASKETSSRLRVLAIAVGDARLALDFGNQDDFAAAVGLSARTIWTIEKGQQVGPRSLRKLGLFLSRHLPGWSIDTPQRILDGEPAPRVDQIDPARARADLVWNKVKVKIAGLAEHSPDVLDALDVIARCRSAGLTDTRLLDAVEEVSRDVKKARGKKKRADPADG